MLLIKGQLLQRVIDIGTEEVPITVKIAERNRFRHFFVMELIILRYFCAIH